MNLRQVVQMHFMMSGKPFDESRSFQYRFPDALWDRLSAYLINLKRLPLWVNRNLSTTVFGGKQTSEFWRTIFLDGTAPQGQQVLASRRYVLERTTAFEPATLTSARRPGPSVWCCSGL